MQNVCVYLRSDSFLSEIKGRNFFYFNSSNEIEKSIYENKQTKLKKKSRGFLMKSK